MGTPSLFCFLFLFGSGLSSEWQCHSGEMIEEIFKCDDRIDCSDGSDEIRVGCGGDCPGETFSCLETTACIGAELVCDGYDDCGDNTDEMCEGTIAVVTEDATTVGPMCPSSMFTCVDGSRCLPDKFVCDGPTDCADGSDEKFAMCCNSKLDIGNETSPCSTRPLSSPAPTSNPVDAKCLKNPCLKKCMKFWSVLSNRLSPKVKGKVVRKCQGKKAASKRCLKCRPLLEKLAQASVPLASKASASSEPIDGKCLKRPCLKKCKKFWPVLENSLSPKVKRKVVGKCKGDKKAASKRCLKCRPLLEKLALATVPSELALATVPSKDTGRRRNRKNGKRNKNRKSKSLD